MADLIAAIDAQVERAADTMVEHRRDLHANPELGFAEHRTTALVTSHLDELGLAARACPTPTGAVYELAGALPGRTVVLRADLDALPVQESDRDDVHSGIEGRMHACGHDAHTAAMLGVASALAAVRDELPGRYVFVFQPAEESLGGGKQMVEGGVLDDLDAVAVLGCHVTSIAPVGLVALREGILMSEARTFAITATGPGGHGATLGTQGNVLLAIATLAGQLSSVTEGLEHDTTACACSAGVLRAGTAPNVVPSSATLRGTLRTFTDAHRDHAIRELQRRCDEAATAYGCTVELHLGDHAPAVVNDPAATAVVSRAAGDVLGADHVLTIPPVTPSDDVSEFLARVPGCYFFVGAARPDGTSGPHHSPTFRIDEGCLEIAARVLSRAAVDLGATR